MSSKNIFAVGRTVNGNLQIEVAPTMHERSLASARWYGALDAKSGQPCTPGRYFSTQEMKAAYTEGYDS